MRFRRINNAIHRDLGYFLVGTTILYAVSGLAVNHLGDWNPNFVIQRHKIQTPMPRDRASISRAWVLRVLQPLGERAHYRSHDFPTPSKLKIYLDDGSVFVDLASGQGMYETVKKRPVFYRINCLHVSPKRAWLVFSDIFAAALILLALTGLFVLKGGKGITGRGVVLASAGILIPLGFMFFV